jgi:hypothetical protein
VTDGLDRLRGRTLDDTLHSGTLLEGISSPPLPSAPRASNGGLIVGRVAVRDDPRRKAGSRRYLSVASSVCWIADGGTRNRPE